jgi:peptidoglycan/xylan/chitin deacetylase (PgdA/CDA1 family)
MTDGQVRRQVASARATILQATGQDPRPLFRFPFGDSTTHDLRLVNDLGYVAVGWTVDTLGWQGTSGGRSVSSVVGRVLTAAVPGEIVLIGDRGRKPCPSGQGGSLAWSLPTWVSEATATLRAMRFRLYPSAAQEVLLAEQCGHARYVWNLALEQP